MSENTMGDERTSKSNGRIFFRIAICSAILIAGSGTMFTLTKMKKQPVEAVIEEQPLRVETLTVKPEDVEVQITGFGQVKVLKKVAISAEVSGRIVYTHPRLEQGEIIEKNDTIFKIDSGDYLAILANANADVKRVKIQIQLSKKQLELDSKRLKIIERNKDLARADYERQRNLFNKQKIGSLSDVEKIEQGYNTVFDQAAQLAKIIALYPLQIQEVENSLTAAKSRLTSAERNLARCDVKAPFTGRLAEVSIETGQYVTPGQPVLTLADDSALEIPVPIDAVEARKWLRFRPGKTDSWLQDVEPVECEIRWTGDNSNVWNGHLHRVIKFDTTTRTVTMAVRINTYQIDIFKEHRLPLIEGMFCKVSIPGRILTDVYRLPIWAVSYKNTVFMVNNGRLHTTRVEVEHSQNDEIFVSKGLKEGDQVITTRLVEPLENSLLTILTDNSDNSSPGEN